MTTWQHIWTVAAPGEFVDGGFAGGEECEEGGGLGGVGDASMMSVKAASVWAAVRGECRGGVAGGGSFMRGIASGGGIGE